MPYWLQIIANVNPLSYLVDALRSLIMTHSFSHLGLDFGVLTIATMLIALVGAKRYPKVVS